MTRSFSSRTEMAQPTGNADSSRWLPGRILRAFAFLLFIAQLGLVAHQIEHYLIPNHMESGEDTCVAFAPTTGAACLPVFIAPLVFIVFFTRFWTVTQAFLYPPSDRLGFRAHAPPV